MEENNSDGWNDMLKKHNTRRNRNNAGKIISYLLGSSVFFKMAAIVSLIFLLKLVFWFFDIKL